MTIKEYMESLQEDQPSPLHDGDVSFSDLMCSMTEIWNGSACKGYTIIAMEEVGLDKVIIGKVIRQMHRTFDDVSLEEAEKRYIDSCF